MRPAGSLTSEASLLERDARAYRAVLLEALIVHPECFPRHYQEEMSRPLEDIERQLAGEIILGAWIKDELVGIVAFAAKSFPKQRHAGTISHLYVKERFRRKGVLDYSLEPYSRVLLIMASRWHSVRAQTGGHSTVPSWLLDVVSNRVD